MRALVLSGGGNKGAYQAGMIYHLLHDLELHYDIVCGVSMGAFNGAFLAMHPRGQEMKAADGLRQLWVGMKTEDVYKRWPFGALQAAWKASVYNSAPLRTFIRCHIDPGQLTRSGKHLRIGAVCLDTGEYQVFHQGHPQIQAAVMASCSFPGAFEPVELERARWVDGGARDITPVKAAIDTGAIRIDALMTSAPFSTPLAEGPVRSYDVAFRAIEVMSAEALASDLQITHRINQLVELGEGGVLRRVPLHVLTPPDGISGDLFDFSAGMCRQLWNQGYADAMTYVQENPSFIPA